MSAQGIRVLVIGGQHYAGRDHVRRALDALHAAVPFVMLIECTKRQVANGRLVGAGYLAGRWAEDRGVVHVSDFLQSKDECGSLRTIIKERRPDAVIRLPGGKMTHRFSTIAAEYGLPIVEAK